MSTYPSWRYHRTYNETHERVLVLSAEQDAALSPPEDWADSPAAFDPPIEMTETDGVWTTAAGEPVESDESYEASAAQLKPPQRKCKNCGEPGHNVRSCPRRSV